MRDIRFRAYYIPEKTWFSWADIMREFSHYDKPFETTEDWKVMQYTGLNDKNGTPVFEGDIILEHMRSKSIEMPSRKAGWGDWYDTKLEVYTEPAMWLTRPADKSSSYTGHLVTVNSMARESGGYLEVIGNIYQNPELIKVDGVSNE